MLNKVEKVPTLTMFWNLVIFQYKNKKKHTQRKKFFIKTLLYSECSTFLVSQGYLRNGSKRVTVESESCNSFGPLTATMRS